MLPSHIRITRVALAAAGRFGFALAGGYAVSAHGMGNRLGGDVDLFTAWHLRASFPEAVDNVTKALEDEGYAVTAVIRNETFARSSSTATHQARSQTSSKCRRTGGRTHQ
ncbi:hypothetical protein [Micromonospora sp. CPCC 205539]|uniref:hypothetical protein n=1 Tax=Micromonospora sp. CPCC 205539 TaxID=3122408 RepID=UPI003FA5CD33